jgi:hypothetical protein
MTKLSDDLANVLNCHVDAVTSDDQFTVSEEITEI